MELRRILYIAPCNRKGTVAYPIKKGFERRGYEGRYFNEQKEARWFGNQIDRKLLKKFNRFKPDLIFLTKCRRLKLETLEQITSRAPKSVMSYVDVNVPPLKQVLEQAKLVDYFLLTNRGQLETYESLGVKKACFWPQACDPEIHYPVKNHRRKWRCQVAFVGRCYGTDLRFSILDAISKRFEVKIWGKNWQPWKDRLPIQGRKIIRRDYPKVCSAAKIMLNVNAVSDIDLCFSNRIWFTLGCGGFLLTHYVPNLEEMFENHKHLVWFRSVDECLELVDYYLKHEREREKIAQQGYHFVYQHHTFDHRVGELLQIIKEV